MYPPKKIFTATPLINAVRNNNFTRAQQILSLNANSIFERDTNNNTPLHFIIQNNMSSIVPTYLINPFLTQYKDQVLEAQNVSGETPLHKATLQGNIPMIHFLMAEGSNINSGTINGDTPLMLAINSENEDEIAIVNSLLRYNADPNITNSEGITAMHLAASSGTVEIISRLLNANGNINALDIYNRTPLDHAILNNQLAVEEYLRLRGADTGIERAALKKKVFSTQKYPQGFEATDICTICMDNPSDQQVVKTLCNHLFHDECIEQLRSQFCPLCRADLYTGASAKKN